MGPMIFFSVFLYLIALFNLNLTAVLFLFFQVMCDFVKPCVVDLTLSPNSFLVLPFVHHFLTPFYW
jgi:hypothetical protein